MERDQSRGTETLLKDNIENDFRGKGVLRCELDLTCFNGELFYYGDESCDFIKITGNFFKILIFIDHVSQSSLVLK